MCNDCFNVTSPDQVIKGCCIVKEGYYCVWDINHMTLVCEEWAELCDLYNVLRQVSHITFNVVAERQRARNALNNLKRDAPFGECKRFPWRKTFVNISCSVYGTLFQNVLGALDYKDRETEKELRYGKDREQKDPDQTASSSSSIDDAKTSFRNNIKSLLNELCKKNEIYDRIKFETKYNLQWCEGPCPTEPGVEVPPGGGPPKTPDDQTKSYGDIMRHLKSRGLDAEDFNVFTEADMLTNRFVCGKELQRLGQTLEKNKLPKDVSNVYVFTTGEYSKCGDPLSPTRGYIYRPASDSLFGETELRVVSSFGEMGELVEIINHILDKRDEEQENRSNNSERSHRSNSNINNNNNNINDYGESRYYKKYQPRRFNNYYYRKTDYPRNSNSSGKQRVTVEGNSQIRSQDLADQSSGEMV